MKRKFVTGLTIAVITIMVMFAGCVEEGITPTPITTSPMETITPTEITRIDAIDLAIEFDENEIAAEQKYKGKIIEVEGMITDFGIDILDKPYLTLAGIDEYGLTDIACYFPSEAATELATLAKWDEVIVRGECRGKTMHVMLKNCELVKE